MSGGLDPRALEDLTLDPDPCVSPSLSPSLSSSSSSGGSGQSPPRGAWWQRAGRWDTVSTRPEDAADILARCPCLPEVEECPWTERDLWEVVHKVSGASFTGEAVRRLSVLLRRALLRVSREAQRLSEFHRRCTRLEVQSAVRLVLSWALAERCVSSAVRAVSQHCMSPGDPARQRAKSARCGLTLSVGRFFRWMVDTRVSVRVHEYAAVWLAACVETLAGEVTARALGEQRRGRGGPWSPVSAELLEGLVNHDPELWGPLQVYEHLLCGRSARATVTLSSQLLCPLGRLQTLDTLWRHVSIVLRTRTQQVTV